ncbi:hypothetical protein J6590_076480 [Homalodisca vitripennis]|nr:hypothetical protein J6590_076480 [Homalodisca vitripennis]
MGTNNLPLKYNGGAGYNGGCGKCEALHCMADLLYTTRIRFPNSVVLVDSILPRSDIGGTALAQFNEQLELMSGNFGVVFLNWNQLVRRYRLARDDRHLNRKGVSVFGAALLNVYEQLTSCEMASDGVLSSAESAVASGVLPVNVVGGCLLKPVAYGVDAVTRGELEVDDVEVGLLETVVDGVEAVLNVELPVDSDKSGLPRLVDDGNVVQSKNGYCDVVDILTIYDSRGVRVSDHKMTYVDIKTKKSRRPPRFVTYRDFSRFDIDKMIHCTSSIRWEDAMSMNNVDDILDLINSAIIQVFNENAPLVGYIRE